ncbi:MAG TPA: ATP:cob(I)alamin adenosyltransferase [Pyrodictium sp.]|nr:ATP:cob(I)alamin adenosyltransferase [Pyrodictium sp.]
MPSAGGSCIGLETEALIAGRLVKLPKHSPVIEFYGVLEEAEALIARARVQLEPRNPGLAERLYKLQRAVRLLPGVLAGSVDPREPLRFIEEAGEGLEQPSGWSLTGCTPEDPDIVLAMTRLRTGDRLVARAYSEGVIPRDMAQLLSVLLERASYTLYTIHWSLCAKAPASQKLTARSILELA